VVHRVKYLELLVRIRRRMTTTEERIESLDRALDEIEVIEAIYGCAEQDDDAASAFSIISVAEHQKAKDFFATGSSDDASSGASIPQLEIELRIPIINNDNDVEPVCDATLRWCLPPGYPLIPAVVSIISLTALRRGSREELSNEINQHAKELAGQEAILQLVECVKEKVAEHLARDRLISNNVDTVTDEAQSSHSTKWGRRWIWVHHITNIDRCKSIVQEAKQLGLGGYLKPGYPGVVVVEGPSLRCDEFVSFIKGNKSRPGGFGRNWGHHVRGHIDFDTCITDNGNAGNAEEDSSCGCAKKQQQSRPQLTMEFKELEEDLATLGKLCRECGLDDEFKEYIMQHKR